LLVVGINLLLITLVKTVYTRSTNKPHPFILSNYGNIRKGQDCLMAATGSASYEVLTETCED